MSNICGQARNATEEDKHESLITYFVAKWQIIEQALLKKYEETVGLIVPSNLLIGILTSRSDNDRNKKNIINTRFVSPLMIMGLNFSAQLLILMCLGQV